MVMGDRVLRVFHSELHLSGINKCELHLRYYDLQARRNTSSWIHVESHSEWSVLARMFSVLGIRSLRRRHTSTGMHDVRCSRRAPDEVPNVWLATGWIWLLNMIYGSPRHGVLLRKCPGYVGGGPETNWSDNNPCFQVCSCSRS